ncbi:MAG: hypothetical protein K2H16_10565 [Prevotella sp.]|nr:hypothetical protein [Prevotella sp.]
MAEFLITSEAIWISKGVCFAVSFDARESMTNWQFNGDAPSGLYKERCMPKICAEDMLTLPFINGMTSIFAERR